MPNTLNWLRSDTRAALERGVPHRHPADLFRLVAGATGFAIATVIALRSGVSVFERDLFRLVDDLPSLVEPPLTIVMQAGNVGFVGVVVTIALLVRKHRVARDLLLSGGLAWLGAKLFKALVGRGRPTAVLTEVVLRGDASGAGFPSGHTAVAAALAMAVGPYLSRPVRRAMWAIVFVVAIARIYVGAHLPLDVVGGWLLGWTIGSAIHLVFGSPSWVVARSAIVAAMETLGFPNAVATPLHVDARGSTPYSVEDPSGRRLFVKALSRDQRDADWLFKATRFLLYRDLEDESPFATPKQQLEHEAYVAMLARRAGARVPAVVEVVAIARRDALLVMDGVAGTDLAAAPDRIDDDTLDLLWHDLALLQSHRIAHRDLRVANVVLDDTAEPWIVDFGFAEASASPRRMARDVAELLASLTPIVGIERSVAPALRHIDRELLLLCPPLLQPGALSRATRERIGSESEQLGELRARVLEALGAKTPVPGAPLLRVRPRSILFVLAAGFALHVFLPLVGQLPATMDSLRAVHLDWLAIVALASALTYAGAGLSLVAACPIRLQYLRTVVVAMAGSFANRFAPSGLGRVGLDMRYVERSGGTRTVAAATEAINAVGGIAVHATALAAAGLVFGGSVLSNLNLPSEVVVVVVGCVALVTAGVLLLVGPWRRAATRNILEGWSALRAEARRPAKLVQLVAGSIVLNTGYVFALQASLWAVGATVDPGAVTLVYLGGAAVAAASPTPGGLGAAEAAYVAGLTATGVDTNLAIAAVLVFRLFTFWLPTLPGWFAFRWLRRNEYV